jgi:hypothetical protein
MEAPKFMLNNSVKSIHDKDLHGKVIAIFTHDTETPPNVHPFDHKQEWRYLVLLDQPALWTQQWFYEDKIEAHISSDSR